MTTQQPSSDILQSPTALNIFRLKSMKLFPLFTNKLLRTDYTPRTFLKPNSQLRFRGEPPVLPIEIQNCLDFVYLSQSNSTSSESNSASPTELNILQELTIEFTTLPVQKLSEDFSKRFEILSSGHFKDVFVFNDDENLVLCLFKEITPESLPMRLNELIILSKLYSQPGFSQIKTVVIGEGDVLIGFTTKRLRATLKDLSNNTRSMTASYKLGLIYRLVQKVESLHFNDIVHRDFSEVNLMVDEQLFNSSLKGTISSRSRSKNPKTNDPPIKSISLISLKEMVSEDPIIIDFGKAAYLSKEFSSAFFQKVGFNPPYISDPEHLPNLVLTTPDFGFPLTRSIVTLPKAKTKSSDELTIFDGRKEDVFSLGIQIFKIITGLMPWNGLLDNNIADIRKVVEDKQVIKFHLKKDLPGCKNWQKLLLSSLNPNPDLRYSALDIRTNLEANASTLLHELESL